MKIEKIELQELQDIKKEINSIINGLGEIKLNKILLKESEKHLTQMFHNVTIREKTLKDTLIAKYGDNLDINIETGEY